MRVQLEKGAQRSLLVRYKRKHGLTWRSLSERLGVGCGTLRTTWYYEKTSMSLSAYRLLLDGDTVDETRLDIRPDAWGRRLGGLRSRGSTKAFITPEHTTDLAELVGVVLGDGHVQSFIDGPKRRSYQVQIAGHLREDRAYLERHIAPLCERVFGYTAKFHYCPDNTEMFVLLHGKLLVEFFAKMGLVPGNKIRHRTTIPSWILENPAFGRACLRGLIDTDGSIHRMSRRDPHLLRINFTSHNPRLLSDTRQLFVMLGFHPSRIITGRQVFLSRQSDIARYLKEVGFANEKHQLRFEQLSRRLNSPVV